MFVLEKTMSIMISMMIPDVFFCFFCFDLFCLDFFIQQLDEILKSGLVTAAVSFWGIKSPLDFLVMPASKHN